MARSDQKQTAQGKLKPPKSLNDALLDEFFCTVAAIVSRLTKDSPEYDNNGKPSKPESEKP